MIEQAILDRRRQHRVVEEFPPVKKALVAGDNQAAAFISPHHQTEEQTGFLVAQREIAEFIQE